MTYASVCNSIRDAVVRDSDVCIQVSSKSNLIQLLNQKLGASVRGGTSAVIVKVFQSTRYIFDHNP